MSRILIFIAILIATGCTEVPVNIPEFVAPDTEKVVLIEELTGVSCPNCPQGALKLKELIDRFPNNVIGVSIHGEFLAEPLDNSKYDFRSETANDLENYLKPIFGKPAAAFNRVQQPNQSEFSISSVDLWGQFVEAELAKPQVLGLSVTTDFDEGTRDLNIDIDIEPLQNVEGDLRISVMLVESHIIDPQKDVAVIIDDYEHNHMFRQMLTAFDGNSLTNNLIANEFFNTSFTHTLPDEDNGLWVAKNMEVVVFISRITPDSKEIFQAAKSYIME